MIVLLSRARLGMYVVGNVGYFENNKQGLSPHWSHLLDHLRGTQSSDSEVELDNSSDKDLDKSIQHTSRVGPAIPLCCPIHRENVHLARSPEQLSLGFCTLICQDTLSCGHLCGLKCHWPKLEHNSCCEVLVESPCKIHPCSIPCKKFFSSCSVAKNRNVSYEEAKEFFRCSQDVTFPLQCGHKEIIPCWKNQEILEGKQAPPSCLRKSPIPFLYEKCKHTLEVSCKDLAEYESSPTLIPPCMEEVDFRPTCGHTVKNISCHLSQSFSLNENIFKCHEEVPVQLPRCGHKTMVQCSISLQLEKWSGHKCEVVGEVKESSNYGPKDYSCKEMVTFIKSCGHRTKEKCENAFDMAMRRVPCTKRVKTRNKYCGHDCEIFCHEEEKTNHLPTPERRTDFFEGDIPVFQSLMPRTKCKEKVTLHRKCGHEFPILCQSVNGTLPNCQSLTSLVSPLCSHLIEIPCHLKRFHDFQAWSAGAYEVIKDKKKIPQDAELSSNISSLPSEFKTMLMSCQESLSFEQTCGHLIEIPCADLMSSSKSHPRDQKCRKKEYKPLRCGHFVYDECWRFKMYDTGKLNIRCKVEVERDCWNNNNCGNRLPILCGYTGNIACAWPTLWKCKKETHSFLIHQCTEGVPEICPHCEESLIETAIKHPSPVQFELTSFFNPESIQIKNCTSNYDKFESEEKIVLENYIDYQKTIPFLKREISKHQRVPIFQVVNRKFASINDFDHKFNVSFFGIRVEILNSCNLAALQSRMSANTNVCLLIGIASVLRVYEHKGGTPTSLKGKKKGNLLRKVQREGYDSITFTDKGKESLIILDPFPVLMKHWVSASALSIEDALKKVAGHSVFNLPPTQLCLKKPKGPIKKIELSEEIKVNKTSKPNDTNNKDIVNLLSGTDFEGLLPQEGSCSAQDPLGLENISLPKSLKEDLLKKMTFINPKASPFQGINLLESLSKSGGSNFSALNLFLSLESYSHDRDDAVKYLKKYLDESRDFYHPFALLAASRSRENPSEKMLKAFTMVCNNADTYLTSQEVELLQFEDASQKQSLLAERENTIQDEWEELKEDYPDNTKSEAMEKLLSLTGLTKVKKEAFEIYKASLQFKNLSREIQKANTMTANFCFLG
jgi:hypothetical protein